MMKFDAFISYPHQNKAVADAACAMVEAAGIRCWSAPRDVDPGDEWAEAIVNAIDHCTVMILIFSSHANQSKQVRREVQRAFDRDVPVVPFRVENVMPEKSLAYYMGPVHWLDALTPPLEEHLQKLLARVKALVEAKPATGVGGETPLPADAVAAIVADETTVAAADGACHATGEAREQDELADERRQTKEALAPVAEDSARRRQEKERERRAEEERRQEEARRLVEESERRKQEEDRERQAQEQRRRDEAQRLAAEQQQQREAEWHAAEAEQRRREQARRMAEEAQRRDARVAQEQPPKRPAPKERPNGRWLWPAHRWGRIALLAVSLPLCGGLAILGYSGYLQFRDWRDSPTRTITGSLATVNSASFSPDGTRLVSSSSGYYTDCPPNDYKVENCKTHVVPESGVRLWDPAAGAPIRTLDTPEAGSAAFSPDGKWIAAAGNGSKLWDTVKIWDAGGQLARTIAQPKGLSRVVFSPDSQLIATNNGNIWNVATGKLVRKLSDDCANAAAFSPDGKRIVTQPSTKTFVCDVPTGQALFELKDAYGGEKDPQFLPDGKRIVTSSVSVTVRDAATGEKIRNFGGASRMAVSANGKWIACVWFGEVQIWDADSYTKTRRLYSPQGYSPGLALAPDGKRLVSFDNKIEIWDLP